MDHNNMEEKHEKMQSLLDRVIGGFGNFSSSLGFSPYTPSTAERDDLEGRADDEEEESDY